MIRLLRSGALLVLSGGIVVGGLVGWNLWTYRALTAEQPVADLRFERIADDQYFATLERPGLTVERYLLSGDDWQLDARLVTWSPWVQLLGTAPIYRLDRLSARYRDIERTRTTPQTAWELSPTSVLDIWQLARDGGDWLPGVDAAYGSAVYLPMTHGAHYRITLSARGLVARPYNEEAATAVSSWY